MAPRQPAPFIDLGLGGSSSRRRAPAPLFGGFDERTGKTKRRAIDKNIRSHVWQKYNKNSLTGKCYCCSRPITHDHFEVGHNKAVARGGKDNVNNLRPICGPCNKGMGTKTIESYKAQYFGKPKPTTKNAPKDNTRKPRKPAQDNPFGFSLGSPSRRRRGPWGF